MICKWVIGCGRCFIVCDFLVFGFFMGSCIGGYKKGRVNDLLLFCWWMCYLNDGVILLVFLCVRRGVGWIDEIVVFVKFVFYE